MSEIKSWSFSRLQDWKSCKLKAYLKHAKRIPDPRPSPAAERGTVIHQMAEDFIRGEITVLPVELAHFEGEYRSLAKSYKRGDVELEGEWGLDRDWNQVDYKGAWGRVKLDLFYRMGESHAALVDYKTGRKDGNENKHAEQLQFYATVSFCRFEWLETVDTELYYLDKNELTKISFEREKAFQRYLPHWNDLAIEMTEATEFPANPNIVSCKYCPYGDTGHCSVRVVDEVATKNFYQRMHGGKK